MADQTAYDLQHRSPKTREAILAVLRDLQVLHPMLRTGQILAQALTPIEELWNIEDDVLLSRLRVLQVTYAQFAAAGYKPSRRDKNV